jgi:hypothetical protein
VVQTQLPSLIKLGFGLNALKGEPVLTNEERKILALAAVIDELFTQGHFLSKQEMSYVKKCTLLFLYRLIGCLKGIHVLCNSELRTQAKMIARHALECAVYIGAFATRPEFADAIAAQEAFQRKRIRADLVSIKLLDESQRQRLDEEGLRHIEEHNDQLDALRDEIRRIKGERGWDRTRTDRALKVTDLALLSEVSEIFPTLHNYLNPSVHVFFANLVEEHGSAIDEEFDVQEEPSVSSPINDAMTIIGATTKQIDKLFSSNTFEQTEEILKEHWPEEA